MNIIREKILLLLLGGLAFGCSYTPRKQFIVLKTFSKEWDKINRKELREGINYLYKLKFVEKKENGEGVTRVFITEKGKLKALSSQLENLKNKKGEWDGKWRMVSFDIPELYKKGRDALRYKLKYIGFRELQKSVFIFPYDCQKEIASLVDLFELKKYVRFGILEMIDNGDNLKRLFKFE